MNRSTLMAALLSLSGCSYATHSLPEADAGAPVPGDAGPSVVVVDAGPPVPQSLEACLLGGGSLTRVASLDNNDTTDHGAVLAFAVADDRRLALAGSDGVVKLWTLDGFLGSIGTTQFLYGPTAPTAVANDLAFHGERVVVGDVNGVVSEWDLSGGMSILGGTEAGIQISAIALDPTQHWLAQAAQEDGANLTIRELGGTTVIGPIATGVGRIARLRYLPDGRLLVGGDGLELRAAADPTQVVASASGAARELSAGGESIVAMNGVAISVYDLALHAQPSPALAGSAELTEGGEVLLVLEQNGRLDALRRSDLQVLTSLETGLTSGPETGAAWLRRDPRGELVLAAFSVQAQAVAFGCTPNAG